MVLLALAVPIGVAAKPASGLPPSSFESADGNLVLDPGPVDWVNAPNLEAPGIDESDPDDSYKGGAKHDQACPPAETGGIPPNKDDLTKLYVASEVINSEVFMYIAWQRFLSKESSASAHMGIEFNQSSTPCGGSSENVQRSENDILILYDLEGGGNPTLTLLKWLVPTSTTGSCKAAPAPPCWGAELNLSAAGFADGEVNRSAPITDPIPNPDETLSFTHQFGEAAINLSDAGAFPTTGCTGFGRAQLGSRSSGNSFVSTQKDYLGPIPINISLCQPATISVLKTDQSDNPLSGAVFELYEDDGTTANTLDAGDTLLDDCETIADGTCSFGSVTGSGTRRFIIHEATPPDGFSAAPDQIRTVTFSTTPQTFVHTFVDTPLPGRINLHKEDDADNPLAGVTFKLYDDAAPVGGTRGSEDTVTSPLLSCSTNSAGDCSILNVPLGEYWVVEDTTTVPAGHDVAPDQHVTVGLGSDPGVGQTIGLTFVDPRQHKVIVIVCHEGTNTLAPSNVTRGTTDKTSLAAPPTGITQAALCALGSASFGGISGHPLDDALAVDIGSGAHP